MNLLLQYNQKKNRTRSVSHSEKWFGNVMWGANNQGEKVVIDLYLSNSTTM